MNHSTLLLAAWLICTPIVVAFLTYALSPSAPAWLVLDEDEGRES